MRSELERTLEGANLNDLVVITLRDAAVVMTQLMVACADASEVNASADKGKG